MSNEDHADQHGGWEPIPQGGEYDAEATAFVHLPPEDLANVPLAAPGQGYVPPMILPLTPAAGLDPAATGSWGVQTQNEHGRQNQHGLQEHGGQPVPDAVHWPDPNQQQQTAYGHPQSGQQAEQYQEPYPQQHPDQYGGTAAATGHWNFTEAAAPADQAGHTGQWTVPFADGELSEDSGELPAPAADRYADRTPPATLPGGAPAPWATQEPEPAHAQTPPGTDLAPAPDEATAALPGEDADEPTGPAAEDAPAGPADGAPEPHGAPQDMTPDAEPEALPDAPPQDPQPAGPEQPDTAALADPAEDAPPAAPLDLPSEHPAASYVLHVNGADRPVADAWIGESLLYVLRERLGLAGAKDGCSQGECGACNVQVDGRLVASCLVPAATAAGSEVRTVEGLAVDGEPSDVQRALAECGAVQCGFCIPGMAMTVHDLLEGNHAPSELETRQALCGNLCRCSGYRGVLDAVNEVIAGREAAAEAASAPAPQPAEPDEARIPHQAAPGAGSVQVHLQDGGPA
ncbi:2Fe-2S iron-sulfur cluster-binding protein [Streptomyces sp. NBC_00876]|uniref:2Fe-2S iron-sulfur cluster-binding protein n=1 Tax=Streptomyces sp. NBC_00876 TaxID=2975853 RepID=UPI00386C7034|nr:2Fe-2S iron-sulfur cluster-binding protein [Streptomyces sp. NBC_00876]